MTCTEAPPLNDTELMAYLDGEADHQVTTHLAQCAHCRQRVENLARWQADLTRRLYRAACPPSLELGEYHLGLLPREQEAVLARHLAECPHCAREVGQLKGYLAGLARDLEPGLLKQVTDRARVLIARLVSGGQAGHLFNSAAPALAGLRGQEAGPYLYQAEEIQVAIEVQDDARQPGRKSLLGLAMGPEPTGGLALLWQAEQRVAVVPVDDLGSFAIPDLGPGSYDLILSGPQTEIHIQELQITH